MKMKCQLSANEVLELVRKELVLRGYTKYENIKHVVQTDPCEDPFYEGVTFDLEMTPVYKA